MSNWKFLIRLNTDYSLKIERIKKIYELKITYDNLTDSQV